MERVYTLFFWVAGPCIQKTQTQIFRELVACWNFFLLFCYFSCNPCLPVAFLLSILTCPPGTETTLAPSMWFYMTDPLKSTLYISENSEKTCLTQLVATLRSAWPSGFLALATTQSTCRLHIFFVLLFKQKILCSSWSFDWAGLLLK